MEGHTNQEIADKVGRSLPTVELRLRRIRKLWENEVGP
jgi:DNA-directed RNA polymerase specialized sigma24 family protein